MTTMQTVAIRVFRWTPGEDERWETREVTASADTTVLDALVEIQRTQDPALAFRYACRVGMCGSCAMVVNGRERWACRTRLVSLGAGTTSRMPSATAASGVVLSARRSIHSANGGSVYVAIS